MERLETQNLAGFNAVEIDKPASFDVMLPNGRSLDYETLVSNTPAITTEYDGITNPQVVITPPQNEVAWDETRHYPVGRIKPNRGRNLEVLAQTVAIEDCYGNAYNSLNIKGSDLSNPRFGESVTASRDHIIFGLQESLVMERVLKASGVLRQAGVGTEYVLGLSLPERFPVPNPNQALSEPERLALPNLLERLATDFAVTEAEQRDQSPMEIKANMIDKFQDCDYLVSYRAMDSRHRLSDFYDPNNFEAFLREMQQASDNDPLTQEYLDDLNYDMPRLMLRDIAPNLGKNLGKMHKLGIVHKFLHAGNITALGSIVDLDSCEGEVLGLGDADSKPEVMASDVVATLDSIHDTTIDYCQRQYNDGLRVGHIVAYQAEYILLKPYLEERSENPSDQAIMLAQIMQCLANAESHATLATKSQSGLAAFFVIQRDNKLPTSPDNLHHISNQNLRDALNGSMLSLFPASYYRGRHLQLNEPITTKDTVGQALGKVHEITHKTLLPVAGHIQGVLMSALLEQSDPERLTNDSVYAATILSEACAIYGPRYSGKMPEYIRSNTNQLHSNILQILKQGNRENKIHRSTRSLLNKSVGDIQTLTAFTPKNGNHQPTPIVYLQDSNQYQAILDTLKDSGKQPAVRTENRDKVSDMLSGGVDLGKDSLIVADWEACKIVADLAPTHNIILRMLAGYAIDDNIKPPLIISGISSKQPLITLPKIEGMNQNSTVDDIKKLLTPNDNQLKLIDVHG